MRKGKATMEYEIKYAMISQPMRGKTEDEIRETRERATYVLERLGYQVLDNTGGSLEPIEDEHVDGVNLPLFCLSESLATMAKCDVVFFCDGWEAARGCKLEHMAAHYYGVDKIEERNVRRVTIEQVENGEKKETVLFDMEQGGWGVQNQKYPPER